MSSIEEKLRTLRELLNRLRAFNQRLKEDQSSLSSQLSESKNKWNDSQMERFSGNSFVGGLQNSLGEIHSQVDKTIGFLENKYSTLESHRNEN